MSANRYRIITRAWDIEEEAVRLMAYLAKQTDYDRGLSILLHSFIDGYKKAESPDTGLLQELEDLTKELDDLLSKINIV